MLFLFIFSKIIPREIIPAEMWEKCVHLLNQREAQFPGFMNTVWENSDQRVEQVEEDSPKELEQFLLNEEELEALLSTNFVSSQFVEDIV